MIIIIKTGFWTVKKVIGLAVLCVIIIIIIGICIWKLKSDNGGYRAKGKNHSSYDDFNL